MKKMKDNFGASEKTKELINPINSRTGIPACFLDRQGCLSYHLNFFKLTALGSNTCTSRFAQLVHLVQGELLK